MGFQHATPGVLLLLALLSVPVLWYISQARKGRELFVRRIPGVDAIDEATGRAAELGRPMAFSTGLTGVNPVLYALLGVLSYVARKAARYRTRLLVPQNDPQVLPIVKDVVSDAYRVEGRGASFEPREHYVYV